MSNLLSRLRRRASFANVTASLALFVALGGTSYAAIQLPRNSVGQDQIRTGGVGKGEIKTGGVGSAEIRSGAVRKSEIATGGVGASELHTYSVRAKEIKKGSVKADELDTGAVTAGKIAKDAVTSNEIKDGSIDAADINDATKAAFSGAAYRALVNKAGAQQVGNATGVGRTAAGQYTVDFGRDVSACVATASLAKAGADTPDPTGTVTVAPGATKTSVAVSTFNGSTTAVDEPFTLIVAC